MSWPESGNSEERGGFTTAPTESNSTVLIFRKVGSVILGTSRLKARKGRGYLQAFEGRKYPVIEGRASCQQVPGGSPKSPKRATGRTGGGVVNRGERDM